MEGIEIVQASRVSVVGDTCMNPLCIYHANCADGFGAAVAVRMGLGKGKVDFHAGIYQQPLPDVRDRQVILVDFSYKHDVIEKMVQEAQSVLILDHHKSAMEDIQGNLQIRPVPFTATPAWLPLQGLWGTFDMEQSGAVLAWRHFHIGPVPRMIRHIQDRDLWKFDLRGTEEFTEWLFSFPYDMDEWQWNLQRVESVGKFHKAVCNGSGILRKKQKDIKEFIATACFHVDLSIGTDTWQDIPVVNVPYMWASEAGYVLAKGKPFAMTYYQSSTGYVVSLRSSEDGEDVSRIASHFGGGGHYHAAGFSIPDIERIITRR